MNHDYVRLNFDYDRLTGGFVRNSTGVDVSEASKSNKSRYAKVDICGDTYLLHRVIWLYEYGEFPHGQIDHINGNKKDNSISNLRVVNTHENSLNQATPKNNSTGFVGIYFDKIKRRYRARISDNGKRVSLGSFVRLSDAVRARLDAESVYGYHENHGRDRHGYS